MPDPFDYLPTGLWGDEYREVGGLVVPDVLVQQEADSLRRQQAYDEGQAQADQQRMALQGQEQEARWAEAAQQFVDWPTYMKAAGVPIHQAYDDYINQALPFHLQRMGYSPEEIQSEVQQFVQLVKRPDPDYGFIQNMWESLKSGGASGTRAMAAVGNMATGDVDSIARLVTDQAADAPVAPLVQFQKGASTEGKDSILGSIDAFLTSAIRNPAGAANFGINQFAQSYPVLAAGLVGFLTPVPGGLAVGVGGSSAALDAGAELLGRIATEANTRGVDVNDAAAVARMLQDPQVYAVLRDGALKHGITVGAVDGLLAQMSAGIGGMAAKAMKAGNRGLAGGIVAGGVGTEAVVSGAGEALGKLAAGDVMDTDDIVAEALGGLMTDIGPMALGGIREMRRNPLVRQSPPPTLDQPVSDFEEGDIPGSFPGAAPAMPLFNVMRGRPPPLPGVTEGAIEEITVPPIAGQDPDTIDVTESTIEEITIRPPAEIIADAEGRILASRRLEFQAQPPLVAGPLGVGTPEAMDQAQFEARNAPEFSQLDIRNPENVSQWLADHGVVLESKEQMDAIANVVAAPGTQRQAAIADSIDGLALSREVGAEALTDALMAMSRILPKDPVRKINIAQTLNIMPGQVPSVVASALALEIQAAIEGGVTNESVAAQSATPDTAEGETILPVRQSRRGLARSEPIPATDLSSLANQLGGLGSRKAAGSAQAPQVQPGGGLRARSTQAGNAARGLARGRGTPVAGRQGSDRVVADDTSGTAGARGLAPPIKVQLSTEPVPRRYGLQAEDVANKEAEAQARTDKRAKKAVNKLRKRGIDLAVMTKEEYESTYPGRKYDDDLDGVISVDKLNDSGNSHKVSDEQLLAFQHMSASEVLHWIASVAPEPLTRAIATELAALNLPTTFRLRRLNGRSVGHYSYQEQGGKVLGDYVITDPYKQNGGTLESILHEYTHAATLHNYLNPRTTEQKAAARKMDALFQYVKDRTVFTKADWYGLTDTQEFIAEAMSNPEFQAFLNSVHLPEAPKISVWTAFKQLVMQLLGNLVDSDSVLAHALVTIEDLFGAGKGDTLTNVAANKDEAKKARGSGAPSTALVGTKDGARTYIAYRKSKEDPDSSYTLYATTAEQPRGDPATKIAALTREQAEQIIRDAGSEIIPPVADTHRTPGVPANGEKRLVGYEGADLRAAAFQQKDGTWTYYESDADVRTDPDAKVYKGLSKDQAQRYINNKGFATTPPKIGAVAPAATEQTAVGYDSAPGFRYTWQDDEATLKNIGRVQAEDGTPADKRIDIAATLRNSRFQFAWNKNRRQFVEPARAAGERLAKQYSKTQAEIEELMQNLHIAERMPNKIQQILRGNMDVATQAKKIKALQDKQKAANTFVNNVRNSNPGYLSQLQAELAPAVKKLSDQTVDLQAQYGLIARDVAENIKKAYDYYVPLQHGEKTSTGKAATGSNVKTDRSFARMVEQLERTIARGEQNRVRLMVRNLVRDVGLINNATNEQPVHIGPSSKVVYNAETNSLDEGTNTHVFDPNSIDVYEGGVRERMSVDDPSLLVALHPFKAEERATALTALMGVLANVNRIIAIGKTSLNPAFPPFNFFRDVLTSNINVPRGVSRLKLNMQMVNPATYAAVISNVAKEAFGAESSGLYQEARDAGAFISHRSFVNLDKIATDTDSMFRPGVMATLKKARGRTFDVLSILAQISESVPRYAMYKAALNSGQSKLEAGYAGKTGSVNFELHGKQNPSNYWIFGNAKMQGLAALHSTAKTKGVLSPTILGSTAGLIALGALAATLGYEYSDKDKDGRSKYAKIPNYKKDSLLLFKEGAIGIPIPQEVAPFYVLGNAVQEARLAGGKVADVTAAASRVFTSFLNNLWPGNVPQQEVAGHKSHPMEFMLRMALPSYALPVADIALNTNTFGGEVISGKADKLKRGIPLKDMGSANENQLAVNAAKAFGEVGIDVAPQQLKLVHNYFDPATEGFAFWRDLFGGREEKYQGDIVNPVVRKFTGGATQFYDQDKFDELLAQATQANYKATKDGIDSLTPEEQALARSAKMLSKVQSDVKSLFKNNGLIPPDRRKLLQERSQELILNGIRRYNELRDRSVPK